MSNKCECAMCPADKVRTEHEASRQSHSEDLLGVWLVESFDRSTWTHFEPWCCWTREEAETAAKDIMCDENLSARTRYVPFRNAKRLNQLPRH